MTEPQESPLRKADPNEILKLYSKDPEDLTRKDLQALVDDLRAKRKTFLKSEQSKGMQEKGKKKEAPKQMSLDDIGL